MTRTQRRTENVLRLQRTKEIPEVPTPQGSRHLVLTPHQLPPGLWRRGLEEPSAEVAEIDQSSDDLGLAPVDRYSTQMDRRKESSLVNEVIKKSPVDLQDQKRL